MTSGVAEIALDFLGRGGKRLRPRLCKAVFLKCGGKGAIDAVCDAVECFHKASLVHDDIQDGDEVRYGLPTLWKEHGVPLAIAAGDWLVAHGYRMICESGFAAVPQMLRAAVASHERLCEGQGDDIMFQGGPHPGGPRLGGPRFVAATTDGTKPVPPIAAFQTYLSICERKTGEAFALAAQLGALAAGADDAPFRQYGLSYGMLFQINDDLADDDCDAVRRAGLLELKRKYEDETAVHRDKCAIGVW